MTESPRHALAHWEGEALQVWETLWSVPGVEAWSSVASTNERARQLAESGAWPWTVVVADEQRAGKGRQGRRWQSEAGAGLWFSLVAPPSRAASGLLPIRVGLAVVGVLRALGGGDGVCLKWPNDLWWQDRKLGGILCERGSSATVIGVGLNLRPPAESDFDVRPAGLGEIVEGRVARGPLLGALVASIRSGIEGGGLRLSAAEMERLDACDCLVGRAVRCEPGPGGIARGIAPDGGLRVETGQGIRTLHAGTVRPIGPRPRIATAAADEDEP